MDAFILILMDAFIIDLFLYVLNITSNVMSEMIIYLDAKIH